MLIPSFLAALTAFTVAGMSTEKITFDRANSPAETAIATVETVICVKNDTDQNSLHLVLYETFNRAQPKNRVLPLPKGTTNCSRYDDAKRVIVDFKTQQQIDAGQQSDVKRAVCKKVKGGTAQYYVLRQKPDGQNLCLSGKQPDATIRSYVTNAKVFR